MNDNITAKGEKIDNQSNKAMIKYILRFSRHIIPILTLPERVILSHTLPHIEHLSLHAVGK